MSQEIDLTNNNDTIAHEISEKKMLLKTVIKYEYFLIAQKECATMC